MVRNENYITIQGWMRNELDLKGNELMTYALIYGFCQEEGAEFTGSIGYIADWLGASKRTVHRVLSELVERGLLKRRDEIVNGITFPRYVVNVAPHDKMSEGSDKMSEGSDKMSPNNIVNTIDDINNISSSLRSEDIYSDEPKKADKKKTKLTMKDVYKDLPEELADTLKDFEDMRKAIKKVATPNAMKLILKDLDKLAGDNTEKKIAILEQSIKNSWQGVFPLKEETNNGIKETNGHDHRGNKSDTRFDSGRDRDTPPEGFKF